MKKIVCVCTGLLYCCTGWAQGPGKTAVSAAKAWQNGAKNLPAAAGRSFSSASLKYAPGVSVSAAAFKPPRAYPSSVNAAHLERIIAQQTLASPKNFASFRAVSSRVAKGEATPSLLQTLFSVPVSQGRVHLLQNEFLTLSLRRGVPVRRQQAQEALIVFRRDLSQRQTDLKQVQTFPTVKALTASNPLMLTRIAQALADVAGIGFYGSAEDADVVMDFYQTLSSGVLEPVALTAAARALIQLKAYTPLEKLLAEAKPSEALEQITDFIRQHDVPVSVPVWDKTAPAADWSLLQKPLERISWFSAQALSATAKTTEMWLAMKPVFLAPAEAAASAAGTEKSEGAASSAPQQPGVVFQPVKIPAADKILHSPASKLAKELLPKPSPEAYHPVVPVLSHMPRTGLVSKQYPSGLKDEQSIIRDWLEYFKNGYFFPRNQVEAIDGMSPAKANNVMEYLYYMTLEEAEKVILNPIRQTGRLPDFMYDARLISGTKRLPAGYYKNKFNENVKRFVQLAEEDGSIYTHNVELKDLAASMADYDFKQGFSYKNDPKMTAGLRHNWRELTGEILKKGLRADRALINELWRRPVLLDGGKSVSLKDYFTQTRSTAFFKEGRMPEFFLNSQKWVAWENERRNLAAEEYVRQNAQPRASWLTKLQKWLVLGKPSNYLTVEQFGDVMVSQYQKSFGAAVRTSEQEYTNGVAPSLLEDATPSSMTVKINNFDKVGGVCQMSFSDGGYMGRVKEGYDGTSTVARFDLKRFYDVPVITFDWNTLKPQVLKLKSVPYLKDLKEPDLDQVRAGTMVSDGLDPTRDLLSVSQAEAALVKLPHIKATLYPRARLKGYEVEKPEYLDGGGLAGYLTLFTPDFYPLKKLYRLRFKGWKPYFEPVYFVRKEVPAIAGLIHRDRLTFSQQVQDRVVKEDPAPAEK